DAPLPTQAITCNCSFCRRKGVLLAFFPRSAMTLTQGEEATATYRFNTHKIDHRFCTTCGTEPFAYGAMPNGTPMAAVNLRCVPAVDLDKLTLQPYDGASA